MKNLRLSFYGFGVEVKSADGKTIQDIQRDYSYFENKHCAVDVQIEVFPITPPYKNLPHLTASIYTPRNIRYNQNGISYIDYFGKGLTILDTHTNKYKVYCEDEHLRHEIVFLTIMSLSAQYLDSKGLHRVHGLGIDLDGKGVLILLPQGGGKTTLALELLKQKNKRIKLISEDSPLIDKKGRIFPLPLRMGVSVKDAPPEVPKEYIRLAKRMEFEPKYLLDIKAFGDKISRKPSAPYIILVGMRTLAAESNIHPLSKLRTLQEFVKNSVIGLGLYQGMEFMLQRSIFELLGKAPIAVSRLRNACKVVWASKTYSFTIGFDKNKNVETLLEFIENLSDHK